MLTDGYTADECAASRQLPLAQIVQHAQQALAAGLRGELHWFVSPELEAQLDDLVDAAEPEPTRDLLAQLPPGTTHEQVQWYLKCRAP